MLQGGKGDTDPSPIVLAAALDLLCSTGSVHTGLDVETFMNACLRKMHVRAV